MEDKDKTKKQLIDVLAKLRKRVIELEKSVSERTKVEETLQKSEARLAEAQRITHIGIWELDIVANTLTWSDEIYRLFGLEPQQFGATYEAFLDNIHPDDREMTNKAYTESVKNKTPYNIVHRLLLKDGTVKYVNERSETFYDDDGKPIRSIGTVHDITERRRAEQLLVESKSLHEEAQRVAHIGHWELDLAVGTPVWSDEIFRIFGLEPRTVEPSFVDHETHLHPDDWPILNDAVTKTSKDGTPYDISFRLIRPSGEIRWMNAIGTATVNKEGQVEKLFGTAQDITKRKRAEEKIKEYSKNLEQMVEERTEKLDQSLKDMEEARNQIDGIVKSVADGLIVTDLRHRVILMNRAAEDLLGVRLSNVIGRSIDFAVEEKTLREKIRYTLKKKTTGYIFDFEWPGDDPKNPRIMRARTSVIHDKEGKDSGIITIIHDVTHEREVDRMKTEFLSTAAHELRTPLTSIQGFSELLLTRDDISEEKKRKFLSYINNQSVALAKIIRDLLDISRIESRNGLSLKKKECDINEIIKRVVPYFQKESQIHEFKIELSEDLGKLFVDEEKIEQILMNLIGNSVKYSPDGGEIKIFMETGEDLYKISVRDQGIGMTPDQVEKVFDKFYRADVSDSAPEGTGLGMAIVKHLVEAHKGEIWIESEIREGTNVIFTIPLKTQNNNFKNSKDRKKIAKN